MKKILLASSLLVLQMQASATIRYVKSQGAGTETGNSWANASPDLQLMINQSSPATVDTIFVAAGIYRPYRPASDLTIIDSTNRNNSFTFIKNIKILGGFPATGNPQFADRNFSTNVTVLSGDIGLAGSSADNAYHVVVTAGATVDTNFLMDGFTIKEGVANVATNINVNGVLIQERCGAGWNNSGATPTVRNLIIANNVIGSEGTGYGVGFYNFNGSPQLFNTTFSNNVGSASRGGACANDGGSPIFNNVIMRGNSTNEAGGWYQLSGDATFNNVTIAGNSAVEGGAAVIEEGNLTINNSIVYGNSAPLTPGIFIEDFIFSPTVNYNHSLVQGNTGGTNGNLNGITQDPLFVGAVPGSLAPTDSGNYHLSATSVCINAGSNALVPANGTTDLDGLNRIVNSIVDMGAYEYGNIPLPIEVINFHANAVGCQAQLYWTSEDESEMSYYQVEKSLMATDFKAAGKIVARSQQSQQYVTTVDQHEPVAYYRINAVRRTGTSDYTPVISVETNCRAENAITLYPNPVPATGMANLNGVQRGQYLQISDALGRLVYRKEINDSAWKIDTKGMLPGIYHAIVSEAGKQIKSLTFSVE